MRSAQAYNLLSKADDVFVDLQELEPKRGFPRIRELERKGREITGTMYVQNRHLDGTADNLICHFKHAEKRKLIYLVGTVAARRATFRTLRQMNNVSDQIEPRRMDVSVLFGDIFDKIKEDRRNIIKKMVLDFGMAGIDYHNNVRLRKLSYELIDNTCASTHRMYDEFVSKAHDVRLTFGIASFRGIIEHTSGRLASMNVNLESSVSLRTSLEPLQWYEILEYLFEKTNRAM